MSDKKQIIVLPEFDKWTPTFKKKLFERIGNWNHIKNYDDMRFAKEIRLVIHKNIYTIEIDWYNDIIQLLEKDIPISIRKKINK
jgi:hypothetical protein